MTNSEALKRIDLFVKTAYPIGDDFKEALRVAIKALQEFEPLQIEQLKTIAADPSQPLVWIVDRAKTDYTGWKAVIQDCTDGVAFCCGFSLGKFAYRYDEYGKMWVAYADEPKGGNNER